MADKEYRITCDACGQEFILTDCVDKANLRKLVEEMRTSTIRWGDDDNIPDTFEESWDEAGLVWADRIDQLIKGEG